MTDILEQLELAVRALGQDWGREWLHDLFDGHGRIGELVPGTANEAERAHTHRLQVLIARRHLKDRAKDTELREVGHGGRTRSCALTRHVGTNKSRAWCIVLR